METARIFQSGRSQAVRLPKEFRFAGAEVSVQHFGAGVLLLPIDNPWAMLDAALASFEPGFTLERAQPDVQEREVGAIGARAASRMRWKSMSTGLADKPWCCDAKYSLADIATGCALSYLDFRFPGIDWRSRHANLARIADKLLSRQPFVDTTPVVRP